MNIALFEDRNAWQLTPISLSKPVYAISCGGDCLLNLVCGFGLPVYGLVRHHLREIQTYHHALKSWTELPSDHDVLWINARLVPCRAVHDTLARIIKRPRPCVVWVGSQLGAALLPIDSVSAPNQMTWDGQESYFAEAGLDQLESTQKSLPLIDLPHDVVRHHQAYLAENLTRRIDAGSYREVADGVFVANGATLSPHVVTETKSGPIVLEEGATIGPFSYVRGPVYLGHDATLLDHASMKDAVSLGTAAKIGGEVTSSIIEAYSNKQHHGYLGNSYLGSWVNLGAGTSNSDLKNTYGEIRMRYGERTVATGSQFMGCIIGDNTKSAINTGIFTGKTIGVCAMLYGLVTTNVPSYTNYARSLGQTGEISPDMAIVTQKRVFLRRRLLHRPCDAQLIRDMYELTRQERELASPSDARATLALEAPTR